MRFAVFLLFPVCLVLAGCGSKGPLVLPPKDVEVPSSNDGSKAPAPRPAADEAVEPASEPVVQ